MIIRTCHKINISFSDDNIEYCKVNAKLTNIKIKNQSFFITLHIDSKRLSLINIIYYRTITIMEYMSQEGYDKLVAELQELENVELPKVRDAIAEARDKGDLSENFEYHAAKREQGKLLSRIRFKQKVLENARVLDKSLLNNDCVGLLSQVEITNLANNAHMAYTIVNSHEANLREGKISIKSPIGQALLNKKAGDVVEVRVPAGLLKLRIENVHL